MNLSDVWQLLARKWLLLLLVPLVLSVSAYFFARHLPQTYTSDTTIYTGITSGYSLKGDAAGDYNSTSTAFDNLVNLIMARTTKQEVAYRLLANHLWETHVHPELLTTPAYDNLRETLPPALRQRLTGASPEATRDSVRRYAQATTTNELYMLVNSGNPAYSLAALSHLSASRVSSSDLIRLEFESYNPQLCQTTLQLITQVFLEESKNLREGQTSSVITYYEAELVRAKERLAKAETANVNFNRRHNIINYDEQASGIAAKKEAVADEATQLREQYAGSLAALNAINRRLGGRQAALASSAEVLEQRKKLTRLNATIADQQLFAQQNEASTSPKVKQLQAEAERLTQEMESSADKYYAHTNSVEGIPSKQLLAEWVQDMALVESNRAKLSVMYQRQQQFEHEYERMAPLGATLKGIGREIDLAEKGYLSTLASLNASRASQQNTQLTANLKIIDPPVLPLRPKTSKLMLLVLGSGLGGLFFVTCLVLGLGLLDRSLKKPSVTTLRTGLPVAGLLLAPHTTPPKQLQASNQRTLGQLVRYILFLANTPPAPTPFVVGIFSIQRQEGKTTLCQALARRCYEMGVQTLVLYPDVHDADAGDGSEDEGVPSLYYDAEKAAVQGWQLSELIQNALPKRMMEHSTPNVQLVLLEFPALREEAMPVGVLRQLNLAFLTLPATRAWRPVDQQTVDRLRAATTAPVEVVLSGVASHHSEDTFA